MQGFYPIRGLGVCIHLLVYGGKATLIDTGGLGEDWAIARLFKKIGLKPSDLEAILLTHGHLDHTANLARIKEWSGAKVYCHEDEVPHVEGRYPYEGWAKVCGFLEVVGRPLLRWSKVTPDHLFKDGDELPFWGGLKVLHLPGHTLGHCGFYSETHDCLFSGDLVATYSYSDHHPPEIFNSCSERFPEAFQKVVDLSPRRIISNHYDFLDPENLSKRILKLSRNYLAEPQTS